MRDLLKLHLQLFAEDDSAANDVEDVITDADSEEATYEEDASETEEVEVSEEVTEKPKAKNSTKEYSERLKKDREAIRAEIEKEQNEKLERIAKSRGFDSWEELEEYSNNQQLEDLGVEDKDAFNNYINNVINNNPEILKARKIIAEQEARDSEARLEKEIMEISKLDPSIKTVQDLVNHPSYNNIVNRVQKGASVLDAYKLENFDVLTNRTADAAAQSVYNNINNKQHLKTTTGNATTDVVVPSEVYAMYKRNLPTWTDEQIKKHYAKEIGGNQ